MEAGSDQDVEEEGGASGIGICISDNEGDASGVGICISEDEGDASGVGSDRL